MCRVWVACRGTQGNSDVQRIVAARATPTSIVVAKDQTTMHHNRFANPGAGVLEYNVGALERHGRRTSSDSGFAGSLHLFIVQ